MLDSCEIEILRLQASIAASKASESVAALRLAQLLAQHEEQHHMDAVWNEHYLWKEEESRRLCAAWDAKREKASDGQRIITSL